MTYRAHHAKRSWRPRKKTVLLSVVILGGILLVVVPLIQRNYLNKNKDDAAQTVVKKVSKLITVPSDEEPALAIVSDASKLTDDFLSKNAKTGDEVLIYTKNKLVVIYRPSTKKIAAVGTVTLDPAVGESQNATVTIVDGTNDPQKVAAITKKIAATYPSLKITNGGAAARQNIPYTIVIDNASGKQNLSQGLVDLLAVKHGVVPLGIASTDTDLMILVGKDST